MTPATPADPSVPTRFTPRARLAAWVCLVVGIVAGTLGWLWLLRGPRILDGDRVLVGGQLILGAMLLGVMALLRTTPNDAIRLPERTSRIIIVAVAALFQLSAVALLLPALSEDPVRYRLDGRMWLRGVSPYATAPARVLADPAYDPVDRMVTYPRMQTIYPPVSQGIFTFAAWVEQQIAPGLDPELREIPGSTWRGSLSELPPPAGVPVLRLLFAGFAVACTLVLLRLVETRGISPWAVVLFAWNPLVVVECGGMGHQDVAGVFLLLCALWALARRRHLPAGLLLALSAGVKPLALVVLPFMLLWAGRSDGRAAAARLGAVCVVALLLVYVPAMAYQDGYRGWLRTFRAYSQTWEANGSAYELYKHLFGRGDEGHALERAKRQARLLGGLAVLAAAAGLLRRSVGPVGAGYALNLLLLLLAPVVYPWYLTWVLCFVPLLRGTWGLSAVVWSTTVGFSYTLWHLPQWSLPPTLALAEYLPVYLAAGTELLRWIRLGTPGWAGRGISFASGAQPCGPRRSSAPTAASDPRPSPPTPPPPSV